MLKRSCGICQGIHKRGESCPVVVAKRKRRNDRPSNPAYATPEYRRNAAFLRRSYIEGRSRCVRCHKLIPKDGITIEHIVPLREGGSNDIWNLALACRCNYAWNKR